MRLALGLFVAGLVSATAAFHATVPGATIATMTVDRVADLPPGVVAALGLTLADPGMPYQDSDAIAPGRPLPPARLIWAARDGAEWRIHYEHGGRGRFYVLATLHPVAAGWAVTTERGFAPLPRPGNR